MVFFCFLPGLTSSLSPFLPGAVENDGRTLHFCVEPGPWTKLTNRTDHFTFTVSPEHNKTLMQLMQSAENLLTTLLGKHRP